MLPLYDENEAKKTPTINNLLIILNLVAFAMELVYFLGISSYVSPNAASAAGYSVVPYRFLHHFDIQQLGTLLSSIFMHAGPDHLLGNLLVLYIFGDNVEDKLGHFNYLIFYIVCGICATAAHIISDPSSHLPLMGASGAIAGVLGAYLILFPEARVRMWVFFFWPRWPAWLVIGGWFFLNCLSSIIEHDNVAYFAHIGGFYAGVALLYLFHRQENDLEKADKLINRASSHPFTQLTVSTALIAIVGVAIYAASPHSARASSKAQTPALATKNKNQKTATVKRLHPTKVARLHTQRQYGKPAR